MTRQQMLRVFPLTVALLAVLTLGQAQYSRQPYLDEAQAVRQLHVTLLMEARLLALETISSGRELPEELSEQVEELIEHDLPRVAGGLGEHQARLHTLANSLEALSEEVEQRGEAVAAAAGEARQAVAEARAALLADETAEDPAVVAAAMSRLLLGDPGVAEGYEEAVGGEPWEYAIGWATLQMVKEAWAGLDRQQSGRAGEVDEALAQLDSIYPQANPPERLGGDPEAAEEPSHRIVSLLETVVDASLYPDRQVGAYAAQLASQADAACSAYEAGNDAAALELALAAGDGYRQVADTAALLAGDAHARVVEALTRLTGETSEDDEAQGGVPGSAGETAEDEDAEEAEGATPLSGESALSACRELADGLREVGTAFGG